MAALRPGKETKMDGLGFHEGVCRSVGSSDNGSVKSNQEIFRTFFCRDGTFSLFSGYDA
jgi:hypothetical protein